MFALDPVPLPNLFGFLSVAAYIATLLPSILRTVFPKLKKHQINTYLLKYRRQLGILAFCLALLHGYLLLRKRNFDFADFKTYWIYFKGVLTFAIFTILTVTSNEWSIRKLRKNWKKIHNLTYLAMFLLTWHIWDAMLEHWSYVTPLGVLGMAGISCLFITRMWIESQDTNGKKTPELSKVAGKKAG